MPFQAFQTMPFPLRLEVVSGNVDAVLGKVEKGCQVFSCAQRVAKRGPAISRVLLTNQGALLQ